MTTPVDPTVLRELAPDVLAALVRRYGHADAAEDAVQEALLAAARQWGTDGPPRNPRGWLIRVASRRLVDRLRSDSARRRREIAVAAAAPADRQVVLGPEPDGVAAADDSLTLLFLCCHPDVTPAAQVALTLRALCGLTTAEIAAAFLVPEATMAQRLSRAKQRITVGGRRFSLPAPQEWADRLDAVLRVLYLLFTEGYVASAGPQLHRPELAHEAIGLARSLAAALPDDAEVAGLLALMLLTDARRPARANPDGDLVPLPDQDRALWDHELIAEGVAVLDRALTHGAVGPYQIQAAIAAVHAEAATAEATDWLQIAGLYALLERITPGAVVTLNRAVAVGMAEGPAAGLAILDGLDEAGARHSRVDAVRAHLREIAGDHAGARAAYARAVERAGTDPERRYLAARLAALDGRAPPS